MACGEEITGCGEVFMGCGTSPVLSAHTLIMTTLASIERVLHLQGSAYEFLLWLGQRAREDDSILRDENIEAWRFPDSTQVWLGGFVGMMPAHLRPEEGDAPAFSRLFSSFFSTSFQVSEKTNLTQNDGDGRYGWQEDRRSLVAAPPSLGKKSAKGKAKVKDDARELKLLALEALALEEELFPSRAELEALLAQPELEREVLIWTYFHEIERRANFASQGAPVLYLWREMSVAERRKLDAARVWEAREALLKQLRAA